MNIFYTITKKVIKKGRDLVKKYITKHTSKETIEETESMVVGDLQESFSLRGKTVPTRNHGFGGYLGLKNQNLSHSNHPAGLGPAKTVRLE